ncbi:MAG TPA: crossover junction endodeoxyribonuclease RuvC [Chthoniobacteraceae bacterium]|nr:crossover junction endodeoxyribonuclease RuvC [Chthoniobacteraceae bacterium]
MVGQWKSRRGAADTSDDEDVAATLDRSCPFSNCMVTAKLSHAPIGHYLLVSMRVLAIDASLRNSGVAIIEVNGGKFNTLYFGVIHNPSALRMSSCLVAIRDRLTELIQTYEPDCCALESVIYVQSYKTAITLGAARGSAIMAATERGLPVFEYAPKRIKQATVGNGSADKAQVAFMVRALLSLTETPADDAADALAIGLTHLRAQEGARLGLPGQLQI